MCCKMGSLFKILSWALRRAASCRNIAGLLSEPAGATRNELFTAGSDIYKQTNKPTLRLKKENQTHFNWIMIFSSLFVNSLHNKPNFSVFWCEVHVCLIVSCRAVFGVWVWVQEGGGGI